MKKLIITLLFPALLFTACEKIIDVDLNTAGPKTVVDARLCVQDSVHKVLLSTTGRYSDGEGKGPITGALVTLTDGNGQTVSLTETESGTYSINNYLLTTDMTYSLHVANGDELIDATSTLLPLTTIDSIFFEESPFPAPPDEETNYTVHVIFQDAADRVNFYRMLVYVNDTLQRNAYDIDDDISNGNEQDVNYFGEAINLGDTVVVELWAIDRAGYDYYSTLSDITNGSGFASATPYNPISNLTSGLGHFTVYQRSVATAIVAVP